MWCVYIIKSSNKKWYYIGSTNRLQKRIKEHNSGKVQSTKNYLPFELVFTKEFNAEKDARSYERLLKDKRIEKEKIIREIENKHCEVV